MRTLFTRAQLAGLVAQNGFRARLAADFAIDDVPEPERKDGIDVHFDAVPHERDLRLIQMVVVRVIVFDKQHFGLLLIVVGAGGRRLGHIVVHRG